MLFEWLPAGEVHLRVGLSSMPNIYPSISLARLLFASRIQFGDFRVELQRGTWNEIEKWG